MVSQRERCYTDMNTTQIKISTLPPTSLEYFLMFLLSQIPIFPTLRSYTKFRPLFFFLILTSIHLYFSSSELAARRTSLPSEIMVNEYRPCISGPLFSSWQDCGWRDCVRIHTNTKFFPPPQQRFTYSLL